jgi:hypothetical protein
MRRSAPLLATALLVAVLAACTAATPEDSAAPSPAAGTSTPSPSIAARPTSQPRPSPIPSLEPTPAQPSLAPGIALADLLPDFAGPTFLDEQPTTVAQLIGDGDEFAIGRLLSDLDLDADQLEFASRSESEIALLAFRADGLSGDELADAYVAAAMDVLPRPSLAEVEIDDSLVLQRVRIEKDDLVGTLTVLPLGDAMVIGIVEPDQHDLVERTLWRILHPGPERLLPAELDGRPLEIVAMPGEAFSTSGDVCSFVCPGELQAMAAELGVDVTEVAFAYGLLREPPAIAVLAFEFPGAATEDLMAIREKVGDYQPWWERTTHTVAGKTAYRYQDSLTHEPYREQWVYANDGVLFIVHVEPDGDDIPPIVEAAIAALP